MGELANHIRKRETDFSFDYVGVADVEERLAEDFIADFSLLADIKTMVFSYSTWLGRTKVCAEIVYEEKREYFPVFFVKDKKDLLMAVTVAQRLLWDNFKIVVDIVKQHNI